MWMAENSDWPDLNVPVIGLWSDRQISWAARTNDSWQVITPNGSYNCPAPLYWIHPPTLADEVKIANDNRQAKRTVWNAENSD